MIAVRYGKIRGSMLLPAVLLGMLLLPAPAPVQAQTRARSLDAEMQPAQFTDTLKTYWFYLKDETDKYLAATEKKGEFETTPEFNSRVATQRTQYIRQIDRYIKSNKLDRRVFGVLLKARMILYDADTETYTVACDERIEAPYNIPAVQIVSSENPYVGIIDSTANGYRRNILYLKSNQSLSWKASRDSARTAKAYEQMMYFRVDFVVDINQMNVQRQARFAIIPTSIRLMNLANHSIMWMRRLR